MILNFYNPYDRSEIMKYPKCEGIINIDKYFPKLNPFKKLYIIEQEEDWDFIKDNFSNRVVLRVDNKNQISSISAQIYDKDRVKEFIKKVKKENSNNIIICAEVLKESSERINNLGAFNILGMVGDVIYVDYVGPCFDCREINKGKATHQTWTIPWEDIPFLNDNNINKYQTSIISHYAYLETAKERIKFLSKAYPERISEIKKAMPKQYNGIDKYLLKQIMTQIVLEFWMKKNFLISDGLRDFCAEFNVVKGPQIIPIEISKQKTLKYCKNDSKEANYERY